MNAISLLDIQNKLFKALTEFDIICQKSGCKYSLMCGTLLGAVRHSGFIPWDDDVDVVMYRTEFEKLRSFCYNNKSISPTFLDEKDTWVPRIRIDASKEIFVDIFILDKIAPTINQQKRNLFKLKLLQGMLKKDINYKRYSFINKLLVLVTHCIGLLFPFDWKYNKYHQIATKYNDSETDDFYIADGAFSVMSIIWNNIEFSNSHPTKFRDKEFLITDKYKSVLTKLYGPTYMELPPEVERIPKHSN